MYIPYNNYRLFFAPTSQLISKGLVNPDVNRWELHRVWVIEAKLKPGKRHIYSRRVFYIDEDSWAIVASDAYDQGGKLYRIGLLPSVQLWDAQAFVSTMNFYDMSKGTMLIGPAFSQPGDTVHILPTIGEEASFQPESLAGTGVR
jgi:hypothetical protein